MSHLLHDLFSVSQCIQVCVSSRTEFMWMQQLALWYGKYFVEYLKILVKILSNSLFGKMDHFFLPW